MTFKKLLGLILAIVICQMAGVIGSVFTFDAIPTWYVTLQKPTFSPPNWVFGPVWVTLYTLMGISIFIIWQEGIKNKKVKEAVYWFGAQLFFNAIWSIIFFGLKDVFLALVVISIMWVLIVVTITKFWKINKISAYILLPYLAWVSLASVLNYNIWILNR